MNTAGLASPISKGKRAKFKDDDPKDGVEREEVSSVPMRWAVDDAVRFTMLMGRVISRLVQLQYKAIKISFDKIKLFAISERIRLFKKKERENVIRVLETSTRGRRNNLEKDVLKQFVLNNLKCVPSAQLGASEMDTLLNEMDVFPVRGRAILFLQGDFGNVYYMVAYGKVSLYFEDSKDKEMQMGRDLSKYRNRPLPEDAEALDGILKQLGRHLVTLPQGAGFGEFAILSTTQKLRSASAVAVAEDSVLLLLHAPTYEAVLKQFHYRQKALSSAIKLLQELPLFNFAGFTKVSQLAYLMSSQLRPTNAIIAVEGEPIHHVYLIGAGAVQVRCKAGGTTAERGTTTRKGGPRSGGGFEDGFVLTVPEVDTPRTAHTPHNGKNAGQSISPRVVSLSKEAKQSVPHASRQQPEQAKQDPALAHVPLLSICTLGRGQIIGFAELLTHTHTFSHTYISATPDCEVYQMTAKAFSSYINSPALLNSDYFRRTASAIVQQRSSNTTRVQRVQRTVVDLCNSRVDESLQLQANLQKFLPEAIAADDFSYVVCEGNNSLVFTNSNDHHRSSLEHRSKNSSIDLSAGGTESIVTTHTSTTKVHRHGSIYHHGRLHAAAPSTATSDLGKHAAAAFTNSSIVRASTAQILLPDSVCGPNSKLLQSKKLLSSAQEHDDGNERSGKVAPNRRKGSRKRRVKKPQSSKEATAESSDEADTDDTLRAAGEKGPVRTVQPPSQPSQPKPTSLNALRNFMQTVGTTTTS